ncbi:MAG: DedA family protein [Proteobacteria bacterium]|nr:DedA family protein [Pseudomonadota bacterium]
MSLAQFVVDYGYAAVLAGTLLEGETILLLAGFAAHQGYLSLPAVIGVAFVGGTIGDQIFFWLGRRFGPALIERFPSVAAHAPRVRALLRRYDAPLVVAIRFMYGLRISGPIVIGACRVSAWRFAVFNAIGAAIWAPLIAGLGYVFGRALALVLDDMRDVEIAALIIVVGVLAVVGWRRRRRR